MAYDKVVDSTKLESDLTTVANAIRRKAGTTGKMAFPSGWVVTVNGIKSTVIPTCTLTIKAYPNSLVTSCTATVWDGEKISTKTVGDFSSTRFVIENVVCGSVVSFVGDLNFGNSSNLERVGSTGGSYGGDDMYAIIPTAPAGGDTILDFEPM